MQSPISPLKTPSGSQPCNRPCITCPYMTRSSTITCHTTKEIIKIRGSFDCRSKNIIYVITCKRCNLQYVGQTGNTINERLRGHLADIKARNNLKPVSRHFTSDNHSSRDVTIVAIAQTPDNLNIRLRTEECWISRLRSKQPLGLNLIQ